MKYSLVILDFDGTLVDSAHCITASLERALVECGCACDVSGIGDLIGLPLDTIVRESSPGIAEACIEDVIREYRRHYAALEDESIRLFPGTRETMHALRAAGVKVAVATNKFTYRAELTLQRLDLAAPFQAIVGADQVTHPKPHPEMLERVLALTEESPGTALMVGDTVWDLEMATAAGVAGCAVTWGNQSAARLSEARPVHIIETFPELLDVVQIVVR